MTFWHGARSRPRAIFFVNNFAIDKQAKPLYIINMMNDMMPTIEETASLDILAQIEHEEWARGNERRERWEGLEAIHGPFLKPDEAALVCRMAAHVAKVTA